MKEIKNLRCEEALTYLFAYLDQEVGPGRQKEMEKHLSICRGCFSKFEFEKQLKGCLLKVGEARVSSSFQKRVKQLIGQF